MAQSQPQSVSSPQSATSRSMPARRRELAPAGLGSWATSSPFGLMRRLSEDMDQLFGQLVGGSRGTLLSPQALVGADTQWIPEIEIFERDGNLVVQTDLPGISDADVNVEVDGDLLTISGERRDEREVQDGGVRRTERRYGKFARSIALPEGARPEEIRAALHDDGVLEITVPVSQPQSQRRKIEIQSGAQTSSQSETNQGRADTSSNGDKTSGDKK
jgi:HSP20 family protein